MKATITRPTWMACLTPPGQSALATIGVHGPAAWEIVHSLFKRKNGQPLPPQPEPGRFWLGRLGEEVSDEVVLAVKSVGEQPWLEIHSHGGRQVVEFLLELLARFGTTACRWEELWRQVEGDPLRRLAAIALTQAVTLESARILLDQYHGALARALDCILARLDAREHTLAAQALEELLAFSTLGPRLTEPWHVVVAGAPNVGKSSLVNALAGYTRSVVSDTPGTTRDVVRARIALDGWLIELADTAGLRESGDSLEGQGIELARAAAQAADLCLWVLDASTPPVFPPATVDRTLLVINKIDLPPAWDLDEHPGCVRVSATLGVVGPLASAMVRRLVPNPPPAGAAVPFTARMAQAVTRAHHCLQGGDSDQAHRMVQALRRGEPVE